MPAIMRVDKKNKHMAYTLATIRQSVRDYLDDDEYSAALIDQAINDYQQELFFNYDLRLAETRATVALSASSSTAPLPDGWYKNIALYNITTDHYRDLTPYERDADLFQRDYIDVTPDTAAPLDWCVFGNNFEFQAPADQDYTLRCLYLKYPDLLTNDSDIPVVPEQFREMMKLGAVERLFRREDEYGLSNSERVILSGMETSFVKRYGRGQVSSKPHVMRKA